MRVMGIDGLRGLDLVAPILVALSMGSIKGKFMPRGVYERPSAAQQFWKRVIKGETPDDCWGWSGSSTAFGYSQFHVKRVTTLAHRFSYELHHGPIPAGMVVRHSCHTPSCANPLHLVLGTQADNIADSVNSERHCRGESHGCAKLTEAQVIEIRAQRAAGASYPSLSEKFGVSAYTIGEICRRESWGHV